VIAGMLGRHLPKVKMMLRGERQQLLGGVATSSNDP
jgi:hypothetical protein